jgi:hypothetical protein
LCLAVVAARARTRTHAGLRTRRRRLSGSRQRQQRARRARWARGACVPVRQGAAGAARPPSCGGRVSARQQPPWCWCGAAARPAAPGAAPCLSAAHTDARALPSCSHSPLRHARARARAAPQEPEKKKPLVVKYGLNHITTLVESGKAQMVRACECAPGGGGAEGGHAGLGKRGGWHRAARSGSRPRWRWGCRPGFAQHRHRRRPIACGVWEDPQRSEHALVC